MWKISVLEGPAKGLEFNAFAGATLGRNKADVNLNDPKASNVHACLEETKSGAVILKDLNSTNGIKFMGRKVKEVIVADGIQVRLGQSLIEFSGPLEEELKTSTPSSSFSAKVGEYLNQLKSKNTFKSWELLPFPKILKLEFIKGLQVETVWHIGYGPRKVGAGSGEFPLLEESALDVSFEVSTEDDNIVLTLEDEASQNKVMINGRAQKKHQLADGDLITVGSTIIHVSHLID